MKKVLVTMAMVTLVLFLLASCNSQKSNPLNTVETDESTLAGGNGGKVDLPLILSAEPGTVINFSSDFDPSDPTNTFYFYQGNRHLKYAILGGTATAVTPAGEVKTIQFDPRWINASAIMFHFEPGPSYWFQMYYFDTVRDGSLKSDFVDVNRDDVKDMVYYMTKNMLNTGDVTFMVSYTTPSGITFRSSVPYHFYLKR